MSDEIKHECGIALIRLLKPPAYYLDKYGTALYGFNKLFLLMEKQHNRGHDGMGIGSLKLGMKPGQTIRLIDAIRALIVKSANDVAVVVAEHFAGSETRFAKQFGRQKTPSSLPGW